jgi:hypothetical protein
MAFLRHALTFAALRYLLLVGGQTTHTVTVGLQGSFYNPPTLSAGLNDTVTFVFAGFIHTVTQTTLANPCLPLPGGFNSGPIGNLGNATAPTKTWNLQITDVSTPIWFFCEITTPTSHCASGMVGVVNPPSIDVYNEWVVSAKAVTGTPSPIATVALTGIGAFASQTPAPPLTPVTLPSSSATPSSSSVAPTTSQAPPTAIPDSSPATQTSHLGAIVGGAIGGAVVIALVIGTIIWFNRQQKSKPISSSPSTEDSHFFRYNPDPVPVRRPSEAFVEAKLLENASSAALSQMTPPRVHSPDHALLPNRYAPNHPPPGVRVLEANPQPTQLPRMGLERQTSFTSTNMSLSEQPSTINMHTLANEVATLLRNPSAGNLGQPVVPNPEGPRPKNKLLDGRNGDLSMNRNNESSPPAYRTTMQTPDRSSG